MPQNGSEYRSNLIEGLLRKKFGRWFDWSKPELVQTVGPYVANAFDEFDTFHDKLVSSATNRLELCSEGELQKLSEGNIDQFPINLKDWNGYLVNEIEDLKFRQQIWFFGGLGHPEYAADFSYWGQMAQFHLHEALLLSVGVEPKHIEVRVLDSVEKEWVKEENATLH